MLSKFEERLLERATEDWYALPEALGVARGLFQKDWEDTDRIEFTRVTLIKMINDGLIFLCLFRGIGNKEVQLEQEKALELLCDASIWEPVPSAQWHLCFASTEKGEQVYRSLSVRSPGD